MVKVLFGFPLRQTTGMVASILSMAALAWLVPDCSPLCRRRKQITVQMPNRRDRQRCLRRPPLPYCDPGTRRYCSHTHLQEQTMMAGGIASPQRLARGSSARPSVWAEPSGSAGPAITSEVGSRRRRPSQVLLNRWRSPTPLKAFGEGIASREPDRQTAEIHIRVTVMNRFNALGTAEIKRVT